VHPEHSHRSFEETAQGDKFEALSSFLEKLGQGEISPTIKEKKKLTGHGRINPANIGK